MKPRLHATMLLAAALAAPAGWGQTAPALHARHAALRPTLEASPFGRPLVLQAGGSTERPRGDVYAVVDHPFERVAPALQGAANWCEMLMLQFNVKRCSAGGHPPRETLRLAVGRKTDSHPKDVFEFRFDLQLLTARPDYLGLQMRAGDGPFGTRDYELALEATPLRSGRSFIHMSYAYTNGFAARLAIEAYLATFGRQKVGFSVVGHDRTGAPIHVRGIQGVAERSAMRYFLGIDAHLDALAWPTHQQDDRRRRQWFAQTERYPRQLHEMDLGDYLALKRREM